MLLEALPGGYKDLGIPIVQCGLNQNLAHKAGRYGERLI